MDIYAVFEKLRYHHEDEVVEFKSAENSYDFDDIGKYFSAPSNEANLREQAFAWLVFGVAFGQGHGEHQDDRYAGIWYS